MSTRSRTAAAVAIACAALLATAAFAKDKTRKNLDLHPSPPPKSELDGMLRQPPPKQPTRTPLEALERGQIPHSGNSQMPPPREGISPTIFPPGVEYRRTFP